MPPPHEAQQPLLDAVEPRKGGGEWSLRRWLPLLAAAVTFASIFSAGPLLLPHTFRNDESGRPDKQRWAVAAGAGAVAVLSAVALAQVFM